MSDDGVGAKTGAGGAYAPPAPVFAIHFRKHLTPPPGFVVHSFLNETDIACSEQTA